MKKWGDGMGVIRFSLDPDRQKGQTFSSDDYIYRTDPEWKLILDNLPEGRIEVFYGGKSSMDEMKITKNYGADGADIPADYVKRYSTIYADVILYRPGEYSGEAIVKIMIPVIH